MYKLTLSDNRIEILLNLLRERFEFLKSTEYNSRESFAVANMMGELGDNSARDYILGGGK